MTELSNISEPSFDDEPIEDWSHEQLRKRSKELQLLDENGKCILKKFENRYDVKGDEIHLSEIDDGSKSASTTSDSQV